MDVKNFIEKIEEEFDDLPVGALQPESVFKDVINWNSINSVVLSAMIEFNFKVLLTADDFREVETINELVALIEGKTNE